MRRKTPLNITLPPDLSANFRQRCDDMGMTYSEVLEAFARALVWRHIEVLETDGITHINYIGPTGKSKNDR